MKNKVLLGQFFTKKNLWCTKEVKRFILSSGCTTAYDPFAGGGDLLKEADQLGFSNKLGLDIDDTLNWTINDSLVNIPHVDNAIIITNPPYIAKQSATRKHLNLTKYFNATKYDDIYLLALEKMLQAQKYVVAIIPESFINSNFSQKNLLHSITVLENNPFMDTENPVCVVCFDGIPKRFDDIKVYKNENYINTLKNIDAIRIKPKNNIRIIFNDQKGWLGLRAIDSTDDKINISFAFKQDINYNWEKMIKHSSRHITLINIDVPKEKQKKFIEYANNEINTLRMRSSDIIFTPFKGNTKSGTRRRRLDYSLARAILEDAYRDTVKL